MSATPQRQLRQPKPWWGPDMPTALWIAHVQVSDPVAYGEYAKGATTAIAAHGGVFLARGGRYVQLEGNDRPRNVVARFPSLEKAVECYHSAAYQAALAHAKGASVRDLMVVEEVGD
jgi:uncharacterized protein (DUF1330 family)